MTPVAPAMRAMLVIVVAFLAGCTNGLGGLDGQIHVEGAQGMIIPPGGPFDGTGVVPVKGSALVHVDDDTNTGYVDADITLPGGKLLSVHWTRFADQPNLTGAGRLTFTLKDPDGKTVTSTDVTPVQVGGLTIPEGPLVVGDDSLDVSGAGVQAAYNADVTLTPPQPVWIHVVFESVTMG